MTDTLPPSPTSSDDSLREKVRNAILVEMEKGRTPEEILDLAVRAGAPKELIVEELANVPVEAPKKKGISLNWKWFAYGGMGFASVVGGIAFALWLPEKESTSNDLPISTPPVVQKEHAVAEEEKAEGDEKKSGQESEGIKEGTKETLPQEEEKETENAEDLATTTKETENTEEPSPEQKESEDTQETIAEKNDPEISETEKSSESTKEEAVKAEQSSIVEEDALPLFLRLPEQILLASGEYSILSSDPSRLNIALNGSALSLTGYEPGMATVTLVEKASSQKFSFSVNVLAEEVTERKIPLTLNVGKKKYIRSYVDQKVEAMSSDESVASAKVSGSGILVITAEKQGEIEISVTNTEKKLTTVYELSVVGEKTK